MLYRRIAGVVVGVAVIAALTAYPALAGKGGGASTTTTSSISIASVDGTLAAASTKPAPKLGDTVTFNTTVASLAGWEYPMIAVSCYQDVNGDGTVDTNILGPDVVFTWLDKPSATFTMGGYMSLWTLRGGGSALCRAELDAYGWKSGKESTRVLASTSDWVAAG
ncbi:MAG TPA: hypothetical protein VFJ78_03835 [Gaiellaceae bacterium]|nr:hypothetical protein [Gaiellaceae bacterium]